MQVQNLRECFPIFVAMETYFNEQDQALHNKRAKMRTLWARHNHQFQDDVQDLNNYFNSDKMGLRSFSILVFIFIFPYVLWCKEEY